MSSTTTPAIQPAEKPQPRPWTTTGETTARQGFLSVLIPAYNEESGIGAVVEEIRQALAELPLPSEIIVIDDGSDDATAERAAALDGVQLLRNPMNLGYGHALLRGIAAARGDLIAISDADGSYPGASLPDLYRLIQSGVDHAIGRRTGRSFRSFWLARTIYRWICGYVVGTRVPDANSGMRIFRREIAERLRGDLCLGFSFTTSLTLASIMSGYIVAFRDLPYRDRIGRSHVRLGDALRTSQYLFQLIALYNPLKLFLPLVVLSGMLALGTFALAAFATPSAAALAGIGLSSVTMLLIGLAALSYIATRAHSSSPQTGARANREEAGSR